MRCRLMCRRQSAEERELQRLQASLCLVGQTPQLKPGVVADDDDVGDIDGDADGESQRRPTTASASTLPMRQPSALSLEALQRLQPWSDAAGSSGSLFAIV